MAITTYNDGMTFNLAADLQELAQLQDGWLDGDGIAPNPVGLRAFQQQWQNAAPDDLPPPYIYPTPEGGIQLEWTLGMWELSAEVDLTNLSAELLAVNVENREVKSDFQTADLNNLSGWKELVVWVNKYDTLNA